MNNLPDNPPPNEQTASADNLLSRREVLIGGATTLVTVAAHTVARGQTVPHESSDSQPPNSSNKANASEQRITMVNSKRARMSGKQALLEQLIADDVRYIFGNPGSTEQGFMDALQDYPQIRYILALHEGVAVSMADAYARLTRRPAFVQLHTAPGLGNACAMLYNALVTNSPLVVYAGHNDTRVLFQEPNLSGPLVEMARPVCKWAAQIDNTHDVPQAVRRAFKIANAAPQGPVFLAFPINTLDLEADVSITPTSYTCGPARPDSSALTEAADLLCSAKRPMLMVGDGVARADAQPEVVAVAELLGAPIFKLTSSVQVNAPASHPLNLGSVFYVFPKLLRETLKDCDVLLTVGSRLFPITWPEPNHGPDSGVMAPGAKLIQIDADEGQLGKNVPPAVSLLANPKMALAELAELLRAKMTAEQKGIAQRRATEIAAQTRTKHEQYQQQARSKWDSVPISAARLMYEIRQALPPNGMVFSEALSNEQHIEQGIQADDPLRAMGGSGGPGIGAGLPGALGAQLARPDRKVVGIVSDGASMYSITALWTAAHHNIPVTYVIVNNKAYHVLKTTLLEYYGEAMRGRKFVGMDLTSPDLRFDRMAESMGVRAWRVERPGELARVLKEAIAHKGPSLVDVVIDAPLNT